MSTFEELSSELAAIKAQLPRPKEVITWYRFGGLWEKDDPPPEGNHIAPCLSCGKPIAINTADDLAEKAKPQSETPLRRYGGTLCRTCWYKHQPGQGGVPIETVRRAENMDPETRTNLLVHNKTGQRPDPNHKRETADSTSRKRALSL